MNTLQIEQLANEIKGLNNRLSALENTRQPQVSDWYDFNTGIFTYSADNILIASSDYTASEIFTIGDKVRIYQGGAYKYFYVIYINDTDNKIYIANNKSASGTFNSDAFSIISISKLSNPEGHPVQVGGSSYTLYKGSNDASISADSVTIWFMMVGKVVTVHYLALIDSSFPASESSVYCKTPFSAFPSALASDSTGAVDVLYVGDTTQANKPFFVASLLANGDLNFNAYGDFVPASGDWGVTGSYTFGMKSQV